MPLTPQDFVAKWKWVTARERQIAQEHFLDLCALAGHPTPSFETFPFPWAPGREPLEDPRVQAIAESAKELVTMRDRWLAATGLSDDERKKRILTNFYNQRPAWLDLAHKKLDAAVLSAFGWPDGLSDEEVLERLLKLTLERAGR